MRRAVSVVIPLSVLLFVSMAGALFLPLMSLRFAHLLPAEFLFQDFEEALSIRMIYSRNFTCDTFYCAIT